MVETLCEGTKTIVVTAGVNKVFNVFVDVVDMRWYRHKTFPTVNDSRSNYFDGHLQMYKKIYNQD